MAYLNFNTDNNYSRIYSKGSFTLTLSGTTPSVTQTVSHSLGYVPMAKVWFTNYAGLICPATSDIFADVFSDFKSTTAYYDIYFWVNSSQLSVTWNRTDNTSSTNTMTVYYRIYYDDVS